MTKKRTSFCRPHEKNQVVVAKTIIISDTAIKSSIYEVGLLDVPLLGCSILIF